MWSKEQRARRFLTSVPIHGERRRLRRAISISHIPRHFDVRNRRGRSGRTRLGTSRHPVIQLPSWAGPGKQYIGGRRGAREVARSASGCREQSRQTSKHPKITENAASTCLSLPERKVGASLEARCEGPDLKRRHPLKSSGTLLSDGIHQSTEMSRSKAAFQSLVHRVISLENHRRTRAHRWIKLFCSPLSFPWPPSAPFMTLQADGPRCLPTISLDRGVRRDVRHSGEAAGTLRRVLFERSAGRVGSPSCANINPRQKKAFLTQGITFNRLRRHAGHGAASFPYDLLPRRHHCGGVARCSRHGLTQAAHRDQSLSEGTIYHQGRILTEGVVAARNWSIAAKHFRREMRRRSTSIATFTSRVAGHGPRAAGKAASFVVLEDNLRVPSGVSYMLTNREITKARPAWAVRPLQSSARRPLRARRCFSTLRAARPAVTVPILRSSSSRPGVGNSARTSSMRFPRASDGRCARRGSRTFLVHDNIVYMRTTAGVLKRIDVIYRRRRRRLS